MIRDDPQERLNFLRPAATPGAEILAAYDSLQPWHVFHERYAVCACRTAAAGWRYRSREHFLNDASSMLLEPGEMHRNTQVHKRSDFKVLFLPTVLMQKAAEDLGLQGVPHFRFGQADDRPLFDKVYAFATAVECQATPLEQQSRLASCFRELFRYTEAVASTPHVSHARAAVLRVRAYLLEHRHENVSLDELAAIARMSMFHLVRCFTHHMGMPPHAYQIHLRIERARGMLEQGLRPAFVAAAAGFADQSHFTRHFRRILRVTPGEYLNARH